MSIINKNYLFALSRSSCLSSAKIVCLYLVGKRGRSLSWRERANIAIGAAKGIVNPHKNTSQPKQCLCRPTKKKRKKQL